MILVTRIVDPESGEDLPHGEAGLLLIKGPSVMQGYLGRDDLTAEAFDGEWYKTGDIAKVDNDGFLVITDRLSRFSKLGGEMVPHVLIEEAIQEVIDEAIPDGEESGGEAMVAVTNNELQPLFTGWVFCNVVSTCYSIADLRRLLDRSPHRPECCESPPSRSRAEKPVHPPSAPSRSLSSRAT